MPDPIGATTMGASTSPDPKDPNPVPGPTLTPIGISLAPIAPANLVTTLQNPSNEIVFTGSVNGATITQSLPITGTCLIMFSPSTQNFYSIGLPKMDPTDTVYGVRHES